MIENLFLSVGAMKAGTTWLYEHLKHHPQIHFTYEKEIHYFEQVEGTTNPISFNKRRAKLIQLLADKNASYITNNIDRIQWYLNYGKDEIINDTWYASLFGNAANNPSQYCADFSNLYALLQNNGWQRIKQNCKNLKVVYTMRDPIARVWSHYKFHMQFIGKNDETNIFDSSHFKEMLDKNWFWEHARYDQCLYRLERSLESEQLAILYFEDFRSDPQKMMDQLCSFLNISKFELPSDAETPINTSVELALPMEWRQLVIDKLSPTLDALQKENRIHPDWNI